MKRKNDKTYFDALEYRKILLLSDFDPQKADLKCKEYLEKYPKDYSAYSFYASNLIKIGKFEDADRILTYVEKQYPRNSIFMKNPKRVNLLRKTIVYNRLKLLLYEEKYDECYKLYLETKQELKDMDLNDSFALLCEKKLGLLEEDRNFKPYLFRQIIEYQEEDFLKHIQKHMADFILDKDHPADSIFTPDFPIQKVIEEIKTYIPSDKKLCTGFYSDLYTFKYDGNGRYKNKLVNYFKVCCFHNTSEFITMFPSTDCENLPWIDLNYLIPAKENQKVKKISQIEKFYQKYDKNYK